MAVYNSYTGVWIMPLESVYLEFEVEDAMSGTVVCEFHNAIAESTWNLTPLTVPDFHNGGVRVVAFNVDVVFILPYNELQSMWGDFRALSIGRLRQATIRLRSSLDQPKGASLVISGNDPEELELDHLNSWTGYFRTNNLTEYPRPEVVLHGTYAANIFSYWAADEPDISQRFFHSFSPINEL